MSSRKVQKLLVISILTATFFIFLGSTTYYTLVDETVRWTVILAEALQNTAESLLFNPVLSISDMYDNAVFVECLNSSFMVRAITALYSIAMIIAPITDALIIYSIIAAVIKSFILPGKTAAQRVLVVGYNSKVRKILECGFSDTTVYLWSENFIPSDEETELFLKKIRVVENGTQLNDTEKVLRNVNSLLKRKKITDVLIADDSDARNVYVYSMISGVEECKARTIHFYVQNASEDSANVLEGFFNQQVSEKTDEDTHRDLNIFSVDEIRARHAFTKLPVFSGNSRPENFDVRMLIIGGGRHGQTLIRATMNQSVYSSSGRITIDVIDRDIESVKAGLYRHFDTSCVEWNEDKSKMSLKDGVADGKFELRLTGGEASEETLLGLAKAYGDTTYSYVIVTLPNLEENMGTATLLKNTRLVDANTSIVFRLPDSAHFREALARYTGTEKIFLMGSDQEYIGLDEIIDTEENERIRQFNLNYEKLACSLIDGKAPENRDKDVLWNEIPYFRRRSSRALYSHKGIKEFLTKDNIAFAKDLAGFREQIISGKLPAEYRGKELSKMLISKNDEGYVYPELLELAKTEHRRWNYFFISEGWAQEEVDGDHPKVKKLVSGGLEEKKAIKKVKEDNKKEKVHDCICDWNRLSEYNLYALIYDLIWCSDLIDDADKKNQK